MRFAIKELREQAGITQEKLAETSGISRATIARLESNETAVCNSQTLSKLAEALNSSVSNLFVE